MTPAAHCILQHVLQAVPARAGLVDETFLKPPTDDGVWQARLLAAPPSCPAIDWVWVFKSRSKTVYWGGQGKTYFYNAPGGRLDDKKKAALTRNTQILEGNAACASRACPMGDRARSARSAMD
jgi:hypothetical protein